jgi:hypothetical protein
MMIAAEPATAARQQARDAGAAEDLGRLVHSDPAAGGIRWQRCGGGFRYLGPAAPVTDPEVLARIKAVVIPPAWENVWICADPRGHIQAMETDAPGRRQYRYHDLWHQQRDRAKHDRVLGFGAALPRLRAAVDRHLEGRGLSRDRVLAAAVRLVDLGFFRPGGEEYAKKTARSASPRSARSTSTWPGASSCSSTRPRAPSTASRHRRGPGLRGGARAKRRRGGEDQLLACVLQLTRVSETIAMCDSVDGAVRQALSPA